MLNMGFSKRTLQRDVREIRTLFGIDIEYSKPAKGYFIAGDETKNAAFQDMLEAFDVFSSMGVMQDIAPYVFKEQKRPQGTEHTYGLLQAIKHRRQVRFTYQKFWESNATGRLVEPYALKEFRSRWYLLAKDVGDCKVKSFALDRMAGLEITNGTFAHTAHDANAPYENCFGIISPNEQEPSDIVLSFDPVQGKYVRSLPLHHTQRVIADTDEELRVSLRLFITHDLIMELLSYGSNVYVVSPQSLANEIRTMHMHAARQYEEA